MGSDPQTSPNFVVGLTGGIASGKSTVSSLFVALGVPVLDADDVSREVVLPGTPALDKIQAHFGSDYIQSDGSLNRQKMREHVFTHPPARKELEGIVLPKIRDTMQEWVKAQSNHRYCILAIPTLIEQGMNNLVNRILLVDVKRETQLERLQNRDGSSIDVAEGILAAQLTRQERLVHADDVISNEGQQASLSETVATFHQKYLLLAGVKTTKNLAAN